MVVGVWCCHKRKLALQSNLPYPISVSLKIENKNNIFRRNVNVSYLEVGESALWIVYIK